MDAAAGLASPRLRALAARARATDPPTVPHDAPPPVDPQHEAAERCELCSEPAGPRHRHLVDLHARALLCACRPCSILFDRAGAGGDRYRLVPEHVTLLDGFHLDDLEWLALRIPVDLVFFFHSSAAGRVVALYPGPMGATESLLGLDHWRRMEERNPALAAMAPDVEALLVNRTRGRREGWVVPIDVCYRLAGVFRARWKGLSGGTEVWKAVDDFFEELRRRAR